MVLDYVKSCEACQKSKRSQTIHKAPLTNMPIAEKFGRRHIDFLGPLTEAEDGSKYILLVVDSLTRWPEAFATKTTNSKVNADILYREIFSRYGVPKVLVSDRGQNFLSKLITALYQIFSVKRYHTSSYHPQTNSTYERLNSTLNRLFELIAMSLIRTGQLYYQVYLCLLDGLLQHTLHSIPHTT